MYQRYEDSATSEKPVKANFHEKAHFVKADVAALIDGRARRLCVLRYASIRTLWVSPLLGDSVHCEIHLFGLIEGAAIFGAVSAPLRRVDQVRIAQSPCARPEAIGHTEAVRLALGPLRQDRHLLLFFSFAAWVSLLPSGCLASRAVGVAQWFVDLRAHPQTVQKYRKLPRCGHHRALLRVLASPRGNLLSVTS